MDEDVVDVVVDDQIDDRWGAKFLCTFAAKNTPLIEIHVPI
jgi:hypothetical protein